MTTTMRKAEFACQALRGSGSGVQNFLYHSRGKMSDFDARLIFRHFRN
jgi:hypothetical protein